MEMKKSIPVLVMVLVLCMPVLVYAEERELVEIGLEVKPPNQTIEVGMHAFYNITVINFMDNGDNFLVKFTGPYLEWRWPTPMDLSLHPGDSGVVTAEFVPQKAGEYEYLVEAVSGINPNVREGRTIRLVAKNPPYVRVNNLTLDVTKEDVTAYLKLDVVKETALDIRYDIKNSEGRTLKTGTVTTDVQPTFVAVPATIEKSLPLDGLRAGEHTLEITIGELVARRGFMVEVAHQIQETDKKNSGFGYDEFTVEVTNNGNIAEDSYEVEREIPKGDWVTAFVTNPSQCTDGEASQQCTFVVDKMEPGESALVTYRIEYWPSYAKIVAAVIILIIGGLYYFRRISKPNITKRVYRKGGEIHHVVISVKAPKLKTLQNVIVRDWVSPLAEVLHKEFSYAVPVTNKSDAGTELVWQLGNMAKREERILSYKIKTLVQGSLKMPRAYMRFRDDKGGRERIYTRGGVVVV